MPHTPGDLTRQIHGTLLAAGKMKRPAPSAQDRLRQAEADLKRPEAAQPADAVADAPWRGTFAKKPWHYRVTAVIPHRGALERLERCLQFIARQSEQPYVMLIDTDGDDESFARVRALRSEAIEIHRVACHATEEYADAACFAMDLAMSACRTEYLWCLPSDCFVVNSNMLAQMLAMADDGRRPVIGYESLSAAEHPECKGMVSEACTLLHMPTMRRFDVTWSRAGLAARAATAGQIVGFCPEISLNYRLRERGIEPLLLGSEHAAGIERDMNAIYSPSSTPTKHIVADLTDLRSEHDLTPAVATESVNRLYEIIRQRKRGLDALRTALTVTPRVHLDATIVTASDAGYFHAAELMLASLKLSHDCRIILFDLGLAREHIAWSSRHGIEVLSPPTKLPIDRGSERWQTWNKPAYLLHLLEAGACEKGPKGKPNRIIWIDADCVVLGSLGPIVNYLNLQPYISGDWCAAHNCGRANAERFILNRPHLYEKLPTATRLVDAINAGLCGFDLRRDSDLHLLNTWRFCVEQAAASDEIRRAISWNDQGALVWALEKTGLCDLVVEDARFNEPFALDVEKRLSPKEMTEALLELRQRPSSRGISRRPRVLHFAGSNKPYGWDHALGLELDALGTDAAATPLVTRRTSRSTTVSIIVTARNQARYLKECLASCLEQTHRACEVLYCDDASDDNSVEVARGFPQVRVVELPTRQGVEAARNHAATLATGNAFLFADGDNILTREYVERMVAALTPERPFVYPDIHMFGRGSSIVTSPEWAKANLLIKNECDTCSLMWRDAFELVGKWKKGFHPFEDWHLALRLSVLGAPERSGAVLKYRLHDSNASLTLNSSSAASVAALRSALFNDIAKWTHANGERLRRDFRSRAVFARARTIRSARATVYREAHTSCKVRAGFVSCSLYVGGAERWMISLAKHTPELCWVGCANIGSTGWIASEIVGELSSLMPVYSHINDGRPEGCFGLTSRFAGTQAAVEAVARKADVLIVWGVPALGRHLSREFDGRVVLTCHGAGDEWSRHVIDTSIAESTDLVAVSSAALGTFGRRAFGVVTIDNGADASRCEPTMSREDVRTRCGWSKDDIVVGYLGRFSGEKRPDFVAKAVSELRKRPGGKRFRCWYIGAGSRSVEEAVVAASRTMPFGTVRFDPPMSYIGDALRAMDCFLLPSVSEGFSLATVEAWLCGTPVVTVDSGIASIANAKFGPCAIAFPSHANVEEIADAVQRAIAPENRSMVENARAISHKYYTAEAMGKRWTEYLHAICGQC